MSLTVFKAPESPPETPRAPVTAQAPFGWDAVVDVEEAAELVGTPTNQLQGTVKESMQGTN